VDRAAAPPRLEKRFDVAVSQRLCVAFLLWVFVARQRMPVRELHHIRQLQSGL
jgi:hypothetical protein